MGDDSFVVRAARMSTNKGFQGWPQDEKLLEYLYKNAHFTPFEMSDLIVEVQAPLFVFNQWTRHRTQSYNMHSGRYSEMPDIHYLPVPERIKKQAVSNKQGSADPLPAHLANTIVYEMQNDQIDVRKSYERYLAAGVAKETARINTPLSAYSKMWAKANLRNWLHFLALRLEEHAQEEIRDYANAVASLVKQLWPRTYALFEEYTLHAKTLSRTELEMLKKLVDPANLSASLRAKIHG